MRLIVGIILLLFGVGAWLCQLECSPRAQARTPISLNWVRTANGWEHPDSWFAPPIATPQLHPLVVAAVECLASSLALVAFCRDENLLTIRDAR
jgi:hypothetical protein